MRHSFSIVSVALIMLLAGAYARARTEEAKKCVTGVLPANLLVPRDLVPVLERIYTRSSTFKAQCERIAGTPNLCVSVRIDITMRTFCRAYSLINRRQGILRADVHLPPVGIMFAELVGHEFEHVLEQVEGLNLRALARAKHSGVYEVEHELYETERAQLAGRLVSGEVHASRMQHADH